MIMMSSVTLFFLSEVNIYSKVYNIFVDFAYNSVYSWFLIIPLVSVTPILLNLTLIYDQSHRFIPKSGYLRIPPAFHMQLMLSVWCISPFPFDRQMSFWLSIYCECLWPYIYVQLMVRTYILFLVRLPKFTMLVVHAYFYPGFACILVAYPTLCGHPWLPVPCSPYPHGWFLTPILPTAIFILLASHYGFRLRTIHISALRKPSKAWEENWSHISWFWRIGLKLGGKLAQSHP